MALLATVLLAAIAWPASAGALALQPVGGSFAAPIYVTAPPGDPRLFVVEQGGRIQVVKNGATLGSPFLDISTMTTTDGERGLLSMAFDPNYASNGLFYVDYTGTNSGGTLGDIHVDAFHVSSNPDFANPASRVQVMVIHRPSVAASNHNGGQLQFGKDGFLYISVGDGASSGLAQDTSSLMGKLLRIDPHQRGGNLYAIPPDNPFAGSPTARGEVWSYGHRNPFRFSFDHLDGALTIADVGASTREEIDYSPPSLGAGRGVNFGWDCREGFIAGPGGCSGSFTDPVFDYPHMNPGGGQAYGCAIIGGYVYRGTDIPGLAGRYLYADLCTSVLRSIQLAVPLASSDRGEVAIGAAPHSFGEDGRCELYIAAPPQVLKIVSSPGAQPGSGGCPQKAASPRASLSIALRATKRKVRKGRRDTLIAQVTPCRAAGERVEFLRQKKSRKQQRKSEKKKTTEKKIGTATLDKSCQAVFKASIRRRSKFSAALPETPLHLGAGSNWVKVKVKH